jgi:carbon-monoxide dehydrogenase small subunit
MKKTCEIAVTVNGTVHEAVVEPRLLLADFLRHTLGLTGTHVGCEHGVCGACTVLVDGDSALQWGFCTPGMLMTATDLLRKYPLATDDDIRKGLSGNLCRCTGYEHIVKAIRAVVKAGEK